MRILVPFNRILYLMRMCAVRPNAQTPFLVCAPGSAACVTFIKLYQLSCNFQDLYYERLFRLEAGVFIRTTRRAREGLCSEDFRENLSFASRISRPYLITTLDHPRREQSYSFGGKQPTSSLRLS